MMWQSPEQQTPTAAKAHVLLSLVLMMAGFVLVVGYAVARYQQTSNHPLRVTKFPKQWIRSPGPLGYAGYFRKRFDLPGAVKHAWIKIAAADAYEISINRNPLGHNYLWRPTRPFQNGISEKGQKLLNQEPAMALNFPREYQWEGHDTWRLPTYHEITSSFRQGKNVIAIDIESRSAPARVAFEGEIVLWTGEAIPIQSDETWKAEPVPTGPQLLDWTEIYYWDVQWRQAIVAEPPGHRGFRTHPEAIYRRPFLARWMRHQQAGGSDRVTFETDWKIDGPIDEAYLRLLVNRSYEVLVNGVRVRVASAKPRDLDQGDWVFGRSEAFDPTSKPELLDPDEVGDSFIGTRFQSPRKADQLLGEFRNPFSPQLTPFRYIRTYNRAQDPGVFDPKRTLAESRRTPETPDLFPDLPRPNALKHDLATGGYLGYSIGNLLRQGSNHLEVRCGHQQSANWPPQIAVDGGAILSDGAEHAFVSEHQWTARMMATKGSPAVLDPGDTVQAVQVLGPVKVTGKQMPGFQYRGIAMHPESFDRILPNTLVWVTAITLLAAGFVFLATLAYGWIRGSRGLFFLSTCQNLYALMLTAVIAIGMGGLLECSWTERHEILWFIDGSMWKLVFAVAIVGAVSVGLADLIGRFCFEGVRQRGRSLTDCLRRLPDSRIWCHLIIWILLLGVLVRGYKLDLQPLDDDEYASTQAILAIMETGAPKFAADNVYYTRSPLFHYVTAALALPFGGNLWSLRLQTAGWGVATAWLVYWCGARLLNNRWVGLIAMLLMCLHPFEIFTGHVVRFYQMQQFFAMLTMYWFCRGFVGTQSQRYRIATLVAFLLAVLSQEITAAMGPSLLLGYLVFSKDLGWRKNTTLILVSLAVVTCIVLDFVFFQTLCLTRTEGVSPAVQASVKPHFWYPLNLLSIFIGYSRLHVVPSFFLVAGLPLIWRERNRDTLALMAFLFSGVVMINLLVTDVSLRYLYWLFPVWLLLSVDCMRLVISTLVTAVYSPTAHQNRYSFTLGVGFVACLLAVFASWSPWRIPGAYELRILGDSTGAVRWVRSQKRPGDRIAITEPHTHCALIEGGRCDYDLAVPLLYDFAVMQDGVLVDRNARGEVIGNLDQLIGEISNGQRIWILLNREKFRTRGKNMRWEYPGARFEMFVRKNCELKHRTYLWSVFLWDPAAGHYRPFRMLE